jgi:hypothetical protein
LVYHDFLPICHRHAAGVDVGLRTHKVGAPPPPDGSPVVAEIDTSTDGLEALADWPKHRGVTTGRPGDPSAPSWKSAAST